METIQAFDHRSRRQIGILWDGPVDHSIERALRTFCRQFSVSMSRFAPKAMNPMISYDMESTDCT